MKLAIDKYSRIRYNVAPVRERGLKYFSASSLLFCTEVAPVRERGLKYSVARDDSMDKGVAPVRERGLKYEITPYFLKQQASLP